MPTDQVLDAARRLLTVGPLVPDDEELNARYLGEFASLGEVTRMLFEADSTHIDTTAWPFTHIDWDAATAEVMGRGGERNFLEVDGHWFDALAKPPVLAG